MGYLKTNVDEFLEVAELQRLDDGYKKDGFAADKINETSQWGIVRNRVIDPTFDYFKLVTSSANNLFRVHAGYAYDADRNKAHWTSVDAGNDITIPVTNTGYWVTATHIYNPQEPGICSVGGVSTSLLSGAGTAFTTTLRGQPNFPSKIRFTNSVNYTGEYTVLEVIDDFNVVLDGVFIVSESNLTYVVVGTFTPGVNPPAPSKDIFQYDDCQVALTHDTFGGPTTAGLAAFKATIDTTRVFVLGYVLNSSTSGLAIYDFRWSNINYTLTDYNVEHLSAPTNPLIALQNLKKFNIGASVDFVFIASLDWKFNITGETQNNTAGSVAISGGSGGSWATIASFVNGNWDGWRYYYTDGSYSTIVSSTIVGPNVVIVLENGVKIGSGAGTCITPYAEEIQIVASFLNSAGTATLFQENYFFAINTPNPIIRITKGELINPSQQITLQYIYKNHFKQTALTLINSATYYNELAYDQNGTLIAPINTNTSNRIITHYTPLISAPTPDHIAMAWFPNSLADFGTYFDVTGLGLTGTKFQGWAICNGINTTKDLRGRVIVGAIFGVPSVGAPGLLPAVDPTIVGNNAFSISTNGGAQWIVQTAAQMAIHAHTINDTGHVHGTTELAHNHTVNDPQHSHSVSSFTLVQSGGSNACYTPNPSGTPAAYNTNLSSTGISLAAATTGLSINLGITGISINTAGGTLGVTQQMNLLNPWSTAVWVMRIS